MNQSLFLMALSICWISSLFSQTQTAVLRDICSLPDSIPESSGIAYSTNNSFWTHSDGKNTSALFLIDSSGNLLRRLSLTNGVNIDWEDLTQDNYGNLYIGDLGNNDCDRTDLVIYKISNPSLHDSESIWAHTIRISYGDQSIIPSPIEDRNFDVEAMAHYQGYIYLFTKNRSYPTSGFSKMYRVPDTAGTYELNVLDSIYIETHIQLGRITGADIEDKTGKIALLSNQQIILIEPGINGIGSGKKTYYRFHHTNKTLEAIEFKDSNSFYLTDEKPGMLYEGFILDQDYEYPLELNTIIPQVTISQTDNGLCVNFNHEHIVSNVSIYNFTGQCIFSNDSFDSSIFIPYNKVLQSGWNIINIHSATGVYSKRIFIPQ